MSERAPLSVMQEWTQRLTFMQQSVLIAAVRGPDGIEKNHGAKALIRWYRRSVLYSAFESRKAGAPARLTDPAALGGGSFTGPSLLDFPVGLRSPPELFHLMWRRSMADVVDAFMDSLDALPHHFQLHFMHAAEIVGYRHDVPEVREWWHGFYLRMARHFHLNPETEEQMNARLGDDEEQWRNA